GVEHHLIGKFDQTRRRGEHVPAEGREADPAPGPLEQSGPELFLESGDASTGDRLRNAGRSGTECHAAELADSGEGAAGFDQVHHLRVCAFAMDHHETVFDSMARAEKSGLSRSRRHHQPHERRAHRMSRRSLRLLTASLAASTLTAFALTRFYTGDGPAGSRGRLAGGAEDSQQDEDRPLHAELTADIESLEDEFEARVGGSAVDTADGTTVGHRADERFGFASSLKVFAVAELLDRTSPEELDKRVTWTQADVDTAGWTPVTEKHVDDGLPLEDIAEATLRDSDNAAMNLVLDELGGPDGLDSALEEAGDATTEVV